ncbi:FAD-dependent thymidylate synthase [Heliorestis convoluta]|uniref:Putative thymidylate synthase complementing family protein n=1 Tax=Heliorestis convoluta TaxID=356322 RepID=A0A5Q2N9N7_9FIRM|nr:FAD-dependent thymidylate synthase [Heliorestis convoluta]QGG49205.1 putative thymidylate synthase complementing family protein [Heliorestis convoluta]
MKISNFESTGLEKVARWIEGNQIVNIDESSLKHILKTVNISFVLEGINRIQSTLLCELKDSYVQQSQRYVTMNINSYSLPKLNDSAKNNQALDLTTRAFQLYERMTQLKDSSFRGRPRVENYLYGIPIEDARYILPLSTFTNLCVAMSGDKIVDLFCLINDKKYATIFKELREELLLRLPANLIMLLPQGKDNEYNRTIVESFYKEDLDKINDLSGVVLLNHFRDIEMKVGLGALASTLKGTPSQQIALWGPGAPQKARGVVERVLGYGHESIAEQARTTFGMMCSLVTYHQQLRHRLSQNHREDFSILIQEKERKVKIPESIVNSKFYQEFVELVDEIKEFRAEIANEEGYEKAFSFLLNCDQIKLIISTNARMDISMLADRTCMNAQWEIRELAIKKLNILRTLSNVLYEKSLPTCVHGTCREGKLSCGQQLKVREMFLTNSSKS